MNKGKRRRERDVLYKGCLGLVEGTSVRVNNVVEPDLGNRVSLLRPPRVVGLSSAVNESPVDRPHLALLEHRQMGDEFRVHQSSHVLGADHRSIVL